MIETIGSLWWLIALIVLDVAALSWGADSTDGPDSPEWQRRRDWRGFGR